MTNLPASDQISEVGGKKVTFTAGTKLDASASLPSAAPSEPKEVERISGAIGQLEIYRSGVVKIRLGNDILLNVIFLPTS